MARLASSISLPRIAAVDSTGKAIEKKAVLKSYFEKETDWKVLETARVQVEKLGNAENAITILEAAIEKLKKEKPGLETLTNAVRATETEMSEITKRYLSMFDPMGQQRLTIKGRGDYTPVRHGDQYRLEQYAKPASEEIDL